MSVQQLPSGKWRASVPDPTTGKRVSAAKVLGLAVKVFDSEDQAKGARHEAKVRLASRAMGETSMVPTVEVWRERWLTDPRFCGEWNRGTPRHHRYNTRFFVEGFDGRPGFGSHRLDQVTLQQIENLYLAGGGKLYTIPSLRQMFKVAVTSGQIPHNPFDGVVVKKGHGNSFKQPPTQEKMAQILTAAHELTMPSFAAWLTVASFSGMRCGEVDALRWDHVDFDAGMIYVEKQFNMTTKTFTEPKNGTEREIVLFPEARTALLALPTESEFCFVNTLGDHWNTQARLPWWDKVREAAGWGESLYLATRHYAGWYMTDVLGLDSEDVAFQLGHTDHGELVRKRYSHKSRELGLERVRAAAGRMALKVAEAA